jgi:hypothetical protein
MRIAGPAPRTRRAFHQPPGRENARAHQEYATVTAILAQRTDKAVLLASEKIAPAQWVPLFRLDASSRVKVNRAVKDSEISVQVELEFALAEGLV